MCWARANAKAVAWAKGRLTLGAMPALAVNVPPLLTLLPYPHSSPTRSSSGRRYTRRCRLSASRRMSFSGRNVDFNGFACSSLHLAPPIAHQPKLSADPNPLPLTPHTSPYSRPSPNPKPNLKPEGSAADGAAAARAGEQQL